MSEPTPLWHWYDTDKLCNCSNSRHARANRFNASTAPAMLNGLRLANHEALEALRECREAFRFTREYVGEDVLPAIEGWSWYDADKRAEEVLNAVQRLR